MNSILKFETGIGSWKTFNVLLSNIANMMLGNIVCMVLSIKQFVVVWSATRLLFTIELLNIYV